MPLSVSVRALGTTALAGALAVAAAASLWPPSRSNCTGPARPIAYQRLRQDHPVAASDWHPSAPGRWALAGQPVGWDASL